MPNTVIFSAFHLASHERTLKFYEDLRFDLKVSSIHGSGEKFQNLEQTHTNGLNKKTNNNN